MQKFSNFKCDLYNNCKTVKSLFEVENFLKNLNTWSLFLY